MERLLQIIQDDKGHLSSVRIIMFLMGISGVVDWQHAVWTSGVWTPTTTTVTIILGSIGFKTLSKKFENNGG